MSGIVRGYVVPGMPHPLLAPEANPGWSAIRRAMERAGEEIARTDADLILLYSTQWISVIGHQMQADPEPEWIHVDQDFHDLGSMPYRFRMDPDFAAAYAEAGRTRGLHCRTVAYRGFPIDTGTIVALKLLNPDNRLPACVVSCNMYADRAETLVLGKAAADALKTRGQRAVAVAVTALSARLWTHAIDPADDRVSSLKDDEWNRKLLEFFAEGRLEDVAQLARTFTSQANADQRLKAIWWLAAAMGQHNDYAGEVLGYEGLWGTGGAVVRLVPTARGTANQEFDEEDVETYRGDRNVLEPTGGQETGGPPGVGGAPPSAPPARDGGLKVAAAPAPVGAYPHARRFGDLLFLSGMGPRQPGTDEIPGGPVRDTTGAPRSYDVAAQTRATIANVRRVLEAAGASLEDVVDVTCFLVDMDRDFDAFNTVYREFFEAIGPTRTTIAVRALPTPIAVEMKVVARAPER